MTDRVAEAALVRALDEPEDLVLLYQPIHDVQRGTIWAAEALLRQRREDGQLREASIIYETAEESRGSELFRLDHFLIEKAYTDAAKWQGAFPEVRLNVNLSPREFQEGNVVKRVTELITQCGIDTRGVNIEITETSYIEDPEGTVAALDELKKLGIQLWLDDFGTGHSALTHLQHFPLDGLKLPGAFVQPLPGDARCRAIVKALLSLAKEMNLAVIAEEVERQDQLDFLFEHGCPYIQGFLLSKPMEVAAFERLLESGRQASGVRAASPGRQES